MVSVCRRFVTGLDSSCHYKSPFSLVLCHTLDNNYRISQSLIETYQDLFAVEADETPFK
jgi:hypothetical protein